MAPANSKNPRSRQTLADIPPEPSRGNCSHGLLHRTDAHVWRLYCFFVIGHDRRKILRFNVIRNPNALWIVQQLREAWPYVPAHKFLLFDRDSKFGTDVISAVRDLGSHPTRNDRDPFIERIEENNGCAVLVAVHYCTLSSDYTHDP
jgi:hypothetical protein